MNITKLTISPITKEAQRVVVKNPSPERAGMLIKEYFESTHNIALMNSKERVHKKLPKFLKGLVNPNTWVKR